MREPVPPPEPWPRGKADPSDEDPSRRQSACPRTRRGGRTPPPRQAQRIRSARPVRRVPRRPGPAPGRPAAVRRATPRARGGAPMRAPRAPTRPAPAHGPLRRAGRRRASTARAPARAPVGADRGRSRCSGPGSPHRRRRMGSDRWRAAPPARAGSAVRRRCPCVLLRSCPRCARRSAPVPEPIPPGCRAGSGADRGHPRGGGRSSFRRSAAIAPAGAGERGIRAAARRIRDDEGAGSGERPPPRQIAVDLDLQRDREHRADEHDDAEREDVLEGEAARHRLHEVGGDEHLEAEQDRPAEGATEHAERDVAQW